MEHLKFKIYNQMKNSTHELKNTVGGAGKRTARKVKTEEFTHLNIEDNRQTSGQDLIFLSLESQEI